MNNESYYGTTTGASNGTYPKYTYYTTHTGSMSRYYDNGRSNIK